MFDFSKNYFELFGIPVGFEVDDGELAARYRELQQVVHPDRFAAAGERSQRLSLQGATLVNEAYGTLRDPLKRAQYLLLLKGVGVEGQQPTLDDPEFLIQQMELREALDALRSAADPYAEITALSRKIDAMIGAQTTQLANQFKESGPDRLATAEQMVLKMQFLNKLQAEAEAIEADLDETS